MINAPAGKSRPHSWTWLNLTLTVVYQKDTLNLVISDYFKALYDRGNWRLKLPPSREFKATSPPPPPSHNIFKAEFRITNLNQINDHWTDSPERLTDHTTLLQHPPHGGLFPPHGKLAQGLDDTDQPRQ